MSYPDDNESEGTGLRRIPGIAGYMYGTLPAYNIRIPSLAGR